MRVGGELGARYAAATCKLLARTDRYSLESFAASAAGKPGALWWDWPGDEVGRWFQDRAGVPLAIDFGDGTQLSDYRSYSELRHRFKPPGIHIVSPQCSAAGLPITQKQKVIVTARAKTQE